jgi:hypothetical protein
MFIFHWMFDKLGYMPKIDIQVGKLNFEPKIPNLEKSKPAVKKTTARKPAAKKAK